MPKNWYKRSLEYRRNHYMRVMISDQSSPQIKIEAARRAFHVAKMLIRRYGLTRI